MSVMSPFFREMNYSRVEELSKAKSLSDSTIAGIVSDETGTSVSGSEITGYLKVTKLASERMLVSKSTMNVIAGSGVVPTGSPA